MQDVKKDEEDDDDFGDFEEFEDPNDVKFPIFVDPNAPPTKDDKLEEKKEEEKDDFMSIKPTFVPTLDIPKVANMNDLMSLINQEKPSERLN